MNKMPTCPHFSLCSGCTLEENLFHPPIWNEALSFFKNASPQLEPRLHTDGFGQTRMKAKLAVRPPSHFGLFKKGTHEVLPIPDCRVHHPSINRAVSLLNKTLLQSPLSLYTENPPTGLLRYVQLAVERQSNRIQLTLVLNASHTNPQIDAFCNALCSSDLWHSIWLNFHPQNSNTIFGPSWILIQGEPFLWHTLNQTPIAFHPAAFSQSHLSLFEKMLQQIETWIASSTSILELYAGVGAIGLSLHRRSIPIHLVENNPFAHLSYLESLKHFPPSEQTLFSYTCASADTISLNSYDLIIVDPPRKGLDPQLLRRLNDLHNVRLIYVSCGFESFQRDTQDLLASGWRLDDASGYLLFPGTNHVELLALFSKFS